MRALPSIFADGGHVMPLAVVDRLGGCQRELGRAAAAVGVPVYLALRSEVQHVLAVVDRGATLVDDHLVFGRAGAHPRRHGQRAGAADGRRRAGVEGIV